MIEYTKLIWIKWFFYNFWVDVWFISKIMHHKWINLCDS